MYSLPSLKHDEALGFIDFIIAIRHLASSLTKLFRFFFAPNWEGICGEKWYYVGRKSRTKENDQAAANDEQVWIGRLARLLLSDKWTLSIQLSVAYTAHS